MIHTRTAVLTIAAVAVLGALGGAATMGLGLYNISAQSGHWPGVGPALHTAFRQSIKLRAPDMAEAPDLSDPDLIALGAAHYATACTACHAEPGARRPATALAMSPEPPHIEEAVQDWQPNHLQWIVENGAKMTGMPGWPALDRGEEAWAVTAYLVAVQEGAAPALPEAAMPLGRMQDDEGALRAYCTSCHGPVGGMVPRLDILTPEYMAAQLRAYRGSGRPSGIMEQAVSLYPPEADAALVAWLAEARAAPDQAASPGPGPGPGPGPDAGRAATQAPETLAEGKALAMRGSRDVPACTACHGPGRSRMPRAGQPDFPALAGQNRAFLAIQLRLWRDDIRQGSALMRAAARDLTDAQIEALAAWYAAQPDEDQK